MAIVKGAVKVTGIPDSACYTTFADLLRSLGQYLTVEIPNQNFSNVIISVQQPGAQDTGKIWWRIGSSGGFIGIYAYAASLGIWAQVFPAPGEITWLNATTDYPDSDTPPPGYSFTAVALSMSGAQYTAVITPSLFPVGPGPYTFYPVIFTGF